MNKKIALLIVVHNEKHNLELLFTSLANQTYKHFKIFFIDNSSKDDSTNFSKYLNRTFGFEIEYIELFEDTGYTKGNNVGAQKALEQGFEILFIMNNDLELERNCIQELLNLIESKKNAGAVSPILFYWNKDKRENRIQTYGVRANFKWQTKDILFADSVYENISLKEIEKVDYVSGAALMIKSEFVKKYGLFDPDYFMYNDEIDLGYRMKKAGYDYYVTDKAKIWHNHDWSLKNISGYKFMYYYMMRNRVLYFKKFKFYPQLLIDIFLQLVTFPIKLKMFFKIGSISIVKFYYSGILDGVRGKKGIADKIFD